MEVADLLPDKHKADADKYRKGTDTMDVWFDSGENSHRIIMCLRGSLLYIFQHVCCG